MRMRSPQKFIIHSRDVTWWNSNPTLLKTESRRLFNISKSTNNWTAYRITLTPYNKEIRKAKRSSFRSSCDTISSTIIAARLHKAMAKDTSKTNCPLGNDSNAFLI